MTAFVDVPRRRSNEVEILYIHDLYVFSDGSQEGSDTAVAQLFNEGGSDVLQELKAAEEICKEKCAGIILGGFCNSDILAAGPVPGVHYNSALALQDILEKVHKMRAVFATHDTPLIAAALQVVLRHPSVRSVIPGSLSAAEVEIDVNLLSRNIPVGLSSDRKSQGLMRDEPPVLT